MRLYVRPGLQPNIIQNVCFPHVTLLSSIKLQNRNNYDTNWRKPRYSHGTGTHTRRS